MLSDMQEDVNELVLVLQQVLKEFGDIRMAFGESDEMSFVLNKASTLYGEACLVHFEAGSLLQQEFLLGTHVSECMIPGNSICIVAMQNELRRPAGVMPLPHCGAARKGHWQHAEVTAWIGLALV